MLKNFAIFAALAVVAGANAQMRITEYSTGGSISGKGEFVEFTNMGASSVDMTGWSFDDSSEVPGSFDLSGFGVVGAGESVIMTEVTDVDFRTSWGLDAGVKVLGGNTNNLSSSNSDEINLFDASNSLVDRLTYPANGSPTTTSRNAPLAELGLNNDANWVYSSVADSFGSWTSLAGDIGNPGQYTPVPEPATLAVLGIGALAMVRKRRAKK